MIIKIWETEQCGGGYMFSIWLDNDVEETEECDDGGICTGSYEEAIDLACEQATGLVGKKTRFPELNTN